MAERKAISKKIRFEVFKRDQFTCQYCGRTVPDVILHVDHIQPVSKGGTNDILNLVTSCRDCNLGKGARELSDDAIVKKQQERIKELAEKNEQLEMLLEWRNELQSFEDKEIEAVNKYIRQVSKSEANEIGKRTIRKWLKEYSVKLVLEAVDIAFDTYFDGSLDSWENAFRKIGGICRNKTNQDRRWYYRNYMCKVCRENFNYYDKEWIHNFAFNCISNDAEFERIKEILLSCDSWAELVDELEI